jgi:hypothetical protein
MKKIIVHTGYIPEPIVQRSHKLTPKDIAPHLAMIIPEDKMVHDVYQILNNVPENTTMEIVTNNVIVVYTIREYIVKHQDNYKVEYRWYNYNDKSQYQLITQGDHGDFKNAPDGFFDTIDNLLLQMLGL